MQSRSHFETGKCRKRNSAFVVRIGVFLEDFKRVSEQITCSQSEQI